VPLSSILAGAVAAPYIFMRLVRLRVGAYTEESRRKSLPTEYNVDTESSNPGADRRSAAPLGRRN